MAAAWIFSSHNGVTMDVFADLMGDIIAHFLRGGIEKQFKVEIDLPRLLHLLTAPSDIFLKS